MFESVPSPWLVPFDGRFRVADAATGPLTAGLRRDKKRRDDDERAYERGLADNLESLTELQRVLYAGDRHAVLLVFQAMDAAGKDGTIRAVMSGVDPSGCQVYAFKRPSTEELDHDFLWRTARSLPERGRIGIFNRSYYEEVLVARVHPRILESQKLPDLEDVTKPGVDLERVFAERLESIADHEKHLARNGTVVVKFWLNVSRDEQKRRFLARIDDPARHWKFESGDVRERGHWDAYMDAYEKALAATSKPWAPWYAIPADDKAYMRWAVSDVLVRTLKSLDLRYPDPSPDEVAEMGALRAALAAEVEAAEAGEVASAEAAPATEKKHKDRESKNKDRESKNKDRESKHKDSARKSKKKD